MELADAVKKACSENYNFLCHSVFIIIYTWCQQLAGAINTMIMIDIVNSEISCHLAELGN